MGTQEGEECEQGIKNLFVEIMTEHFLKSGEEKRHTSPGSSESPNQVEPKEAYIEMHHN